MDRSWKNTIHIDYMARSFTLCSCGSNPLWLLYGIPYKRYLLLEFIGIIVTAEIFRFPATIVVIRVDENFAREPSSATLFSRLHMRTETSEKHWLSVVENASLPLHLSAMYSVIPVWPSANDPREPWKALTHTRWETAEQLIPCAGCFKCSWATAPLNGAHRTRTAPWQLATSFSIFRISLLF